MELKIHRTLLEIESKQNPLRDVVYNSYGTVSSVYFIATIATCALFKKLKLSSSKQITTIHVSRPTIECGFSLLISYCECILEHLQATLTIEKTMQGGSEDVIGGKKRIL